MCFVTWDGCFELLVCMLYHNICLEMIGNDFDVAGAEKKAQQVGLSPLVRRRDAVTTYQQQSSSQIQLTVITQWKLGVVFLKIIVSSAIFSTYDKECLVAKSHVRALFNLPSCRIIRYANKNCG